MCGIILFLTLNQEKVEDFYISCQLDIGLISFTNTDSGFWREEIGSITLTSNNLCVYTSGSSLYCIPTHAQYFSAYKRRQSDMINPEDRALELSLL